MALALIATSAKAEELSALDSCLLAQLRDSSNGNQTVSELRRRCISPLETAAQGNTEKEATIDSAPMAMPSGFRSFFTPYKENYILFGSMQNKDGSDPFSGKTFDIRFEFGMKFRLFQNEDDFDKTSPIYVGYSQKAWWDIAESSAPFREHNYNPEVFWDFREDEIYGREEDAFLLEKIGDYVDRIGVEHQSNGLAGLESRSWDRIYAQRTFATEDNDFSFRLKAWNVINLGNENADITDYLGNLEAKLSYRPNKRFEFNGSVMKGHHTSKYSYRLDLISSLGELSNSKFMLSYYDGFGEALISYNQKTQSLRAGVFIPIEF